MLVQMGKCMMVTVIYTYECSYNWHSARYMAKASNNGRSPYAIALIYRLCINIVTKLILLQQPDEAKITGTLLCFLIVKASAIF